MKDKKDKQINADLFSQPPLVIFTKGANISGGHCIYHNKIYLRKSKSLDKIKIYILHIFTLYICKSFSLEFY